MLAYWEMIADKLSKKGWSVGWSRIVNAEGILLWSADAGRHSFRFVGQAEELTTAFLEVERMIAEHGSGRDEL